MTLLFFFKEKQLLTCISKVNIYSNVPSFEKRLFVFKLIVAFYQNDTKMGKLTNATTKMMNFWLRKFKSTISYMIQEIRVKKKKKKKVEELCFV